MQPVLLSCHEGTQASPPRQGTAPGEVSHSLGSSGLGVNVPVV